MSSHLCLEDRLSIWRRGLHVRAGGSGKEAQKQGLGQGAGWGAAPKACFSVQEAAS